MPSSRSHQTELSYFDHTTSLVYTRMLLCFSEPCGQSQVLSVLQEGLDQTAKDIPFLAGDVVAATPCQPRHINLSGKQCLIKSKSVEELPLESRDYDSLYAKCFPTSTFDETFLPVLTYDCSGAPNPVLVAQANFLNGGLVLALCFCHPALDTYAAMIVVDRWSRYCKNLSDPSVEIPILPDETFDRSGPLKERASVSGRVGTKPHTLSEWVVNQPRELEEPLPQPNDAILAFSSHSTSMFHMSAESLASLKLIASPKNCSVPMPPEAYVSTNDAITALVFITTMRARFSSARTQAHDEASVNESAVPAFAATNIEVRQRLKLPVTYLASPIVIRAAEFPLSRIIAESGREDPSLLADVAQAIHQVIKSTDSDYLDDLMAYFAKHQEMGDIDRIKGFFRPEIGKGRGCMMTNWNWKRSYHAGNVRSALQHETSPYLHDWGKTVGGRIDKIRFPKGGIWSGANAVMPTDDRMPGGGVEICISALLRNQLGRNELEFFRRDIAWTRWATWIAD